MVEEWRNYNGVNMLKKYYDNQKKYGFTFQVLTYLSYLLFFFFTYFETVYLLSICHHQALIIFYFI
ncbi:MAG: hypothetical protein FD143_3426 [Ignavibacteria bacterium]|nr:MAG: hypothetical protein FD143_3426 [Ignavibacteria bacterium]